jgi:hypothetical protein
MEQTPGVAILATQLAATDRRSLSQAWYDALHLVAHDPRAGDSVQQRYSEAKRFGRAPARSREDRAGARSETVRAVRTHADPAAGAMLPERRAPKTELARRIERVLARPRAQHAASSVAIHAADGRVQILVRGDGERTRIVALCVPTLRERVDRALAQARFALAGRGVQSELV